MTNKSYRRAHTQPLTCYTCRATGATIRVSEMQRMQNVDGRERLHAVVRCLACKNPWWSRHSDALARSRAADAEAAKGATDER